VVEPGRRRPAFYALSPGGWREFVTLLHPPYTAWHLSYVALGAALAPSFALWKLGATLAAFLLALGVGCHALDELCGRPLQTSIGAGVLVVLAALGLGGAVAIGILGAVIVSAWLVPAILAGSFLALAYNLELFGGRFHNDLWFAISWGAFPALTGWLAQSQSIRPQALLVAFACLLVSLAQRRLSTPARALRRRTASVSGSQTLEDGSVLELDAARLLEPLEGALSVLSVAMVALATAVVIARLSAG